MNISEILAQAVEYGVSDVILSPFNPPSVRMGGLVRPLFQDLSELSPDTTRELAETLLDDRALESLEAMGSAVIGVGIESIGRFKVSVFRQRGMFTIVMRRVFPQVPGLEGLGLQPHVISAITAPGGGLVLIGGSGSSGRSTTLACAVVSVAASCEGHIVTLEEPVEYFHSFGLSVVDQRDIGRDVPDLRAGLRQAMTLGPEVICIDSPMVQEHVSDIMEALRRGIKVIATFPGCDSVDILESFAGGLTTERVNGRPPVWAMSAVGGFLLCTICQRLEPGDQGQAIAQWETIPAMEPALSLLRDGKFDLLRAGVSGREGFQLFDDRGRGSAKYKGGAGANSGTTGEGGGADSASSSNSGQSIARLEKMLYAQDVAKRQEAETILKELAQGGDTEASMILEQFAQFYITNFEDRKRGITKSR